MDDEKMEKYQGRNEDDSKIASPSLQNPTDPATPQAIIGIQRHRLNSDGAGVTTLVGFHGCPLRCKLCLNPQCFSPNAKVMRLTPRQLYERVLPDQLYFLATDGGVTFGGGEPLLYPSFLSEFRSLCGSVWRLRAETCLNVPFENVRVAAGCLDEFFVDCKDTDPAIYRSYTGQDNGLMLDNLARLVELTSPDRITVRIPLIPGYNKEQDRQRSLKRLKALGLSKFDLFSYQSPSPDKLREQ